MKIRVKDVVWPNKADIDLRRYDVAGLKALRC
jgi:hypothetical protein